MNTQTFNGRVSEFLIKFFGDPIILARWQDKKMNQRHWLNSVKKDLFHLISIAAVALGQKQQNKAAFSLNPKQVDQIEKLGKLWMQLRGREVHPPNSQDSSAKRAIRVGLASLVDAAIAEEELVLLTNLCPNHRFDDGGIFVSNEIHPKAREAAKELAEIRQMLVEVGVKNLTHIILFGDVDLSQALVERFDKKELKTQLDANFDAWKKLFADDNVEFLRMTEFFSEEEWEKKQKNLLGRIEDGFLHQQVKKVVKGRNGSKFAQRSGRMVTEQEVLQRTQDSIAAHLATNQLVKERFPKALMLDISGGIDLTWTVNTFGDPVVCISAVRNHQPWRDN